MGAMQTVNRDRLQMSVCGQATPLWRWWTKKREENYSRDEKGKGVSLGLALPSSSQVHLWSVMYMMEIDFQVNCFVYLS